MSLLSYDIYYLSNTTREKIKEIRLIKATYKKIKGNGGGHLYLCDCLWNSLFLIKGQYIPALSKMEVNKLRVWFSIIVKKERF